MEKIGLVWATQGIPGGDCYTADIIDGIQGIMREVPSESNCVRDSDGYAKQWATVEEATAYLLAAGCACVEMA